MWLGAQTRAHAQYTHLHCIEVIMLAYGYFLLSVLSTTVIQIMVVPNWVNQTWCPTFICWCVRFLENIQAKGISPRTTDIMQRGWRPATIRNVLGKLAEIL
jgi:hypothetical protein